MKKIFMLLLIFGIIFTVPSSVFADNVDNTEYIEFDESSEYIEFDESVLMKAVSTPTPDGVRGVEIVDGKTTKALAGSDGISTRSVSVGDVEINGVGPVMIRQAPNSTVVQVYLAYVGQKTANAAKFEKFEVQSESLIFQKTYGKFTPKVYPFDYPSSLYFVYLGNIDIPVDVDKARIEDKGVMVYYMDSGWNSFTNIIGAWPIQTP